MLQELNQHQQDMLNQIAAESGLEPAAVIDRALELLRSYMASLEALRADPLEGASQAGRDRVFGGEPLDADDQLFMAEIEAGLNDVKRGNLASQAEVEAFFQKYTR